MSGIRENIGVKNGLILGGVLIALSMFLYLINKSFFLNPYTRFVASLLIPIIIIRKSILEQREENSGYIKFQEALQPGYLTLIVGVVIFSIFQFIIMSVDFELLEIQREMAISNMKAISEFAGISEENIAEFEQMKAEDLKPNLRTFFLGLAKNFIFGFLMVAICAFALKHENLSND